MKRDLFVTDFWEFDFPYHDKFKKQILDYITNHPIAKTHINDNKDINPSLDSYGGDELDFDAVPELYNFFQIQTLKLLDNVEKEHSWRKGKWEKPEAWLNVNLKGNFNPPHIHPSNHYSGCYYVNFPHNSGLIHFLDPRPQHVIACPELSFEGDINWYRNKNKYDSSLFTYEVKEGKIVIFPSWLMHYVDPNPTEAMRVSIAFNARYDNWER